MSVQNVFLPSLHRTITNFSVISREARPSTEKDDISSSLPPSLLSFFPPSLPSSYLLSPSLHIPVALCELPSFPKHPQQLSGCCIVCLLPYDLQTTKSSWRPNTRTTTHSAQSASQNALYTLTILSSPFIISYHIQIFKWSPILGHLKIRCPGGARKAAQQEISGTFQCLSWYDNLQNSQGFQRQHWEHDQVQNLSSYLKSQEIYIYI